MYTTTRRLARSHVVNVSELEAIGPAAVHDRTHLQPLDILLISLEETSCTWCLGLLRLLKAHLEATNVPAFGQEVLN